MVTEETDIMPATLLVLLANQLTKVWEFEFPIVELRNL